MRMPPWSRVRDITTHFVPAKPWIAHSCVRHLESFAAARFVEGVRRVEDLGCAGEA